MNRKIKLGVAAGVAIVLSAGVARADAPAITITAPSANSIIETTTFPKIVNVSGTISHTGGSGANVNLCAIAEFTLSVDDGSTATDPVVIGTKNWNHQQTGCPETENFSFPFTATEAGAYTVTGYGKHASAGETETVDFSVVLQELVVSYPAAPSVAAQILAEQNVSARYGSGKAGGNYIADVAAEMNSTPGTDFQGVAKKNVSEYAAKVREYLVSRRAIVS